MNSSKSGRFGLVLIAVALIAIAGLAVSRLFSPVSVPAGAVNGGNVTNFTAVQTSAGYWVGSNQVLANLSGVSELVLGSSAGSVTEIPSAPTCNSASSTLFAVLPPTGATSTVTVLGSPFGGNATTSSLLIGTSTKSTGLASTDVSANLVNSSNGIATSTVVWTASGNTTASASGFISAGANSVARILVKPGEYVVGYSTSTASGAGAAGYVPGYTTCTPKLLFTS